MFKFYYKVFIKGIFYKYYKIIIAKDLKSAKNEFLNFINLKYDISIKLQIVKIEKIENNKIYDLKVGEKDV